MLFSHNSDKNPTVRDNLVETGIGCEFKLASNTKKGTTHEPHLRNLTG